ncbi:hypothetical protein L210DRAFT_3555217 [Boletus edulis BED1]|uniref:Uncharacterized protein n=1 Tax=Boletus edulis BED1 TaxID=1328754 RepID=A0AAD4GAL9_BOLED|nr:hypothetical protein L210DRAFT_3555217 [Boletus edulis BED1]
MAIIHALFAVGSRSFESMIVVFINTFVDLIRRLDREFDMVVDCIANGIIPDLDGIAEVRRHLELNIVADPERAAEVGSVVRLLGQGGVFTFGQTCV